MILIVSYPGEEHTAMVAALLERAGREVVQVDLAEFPMRRTLEARWSNNGSPSFLIEHEGGRTELSGVHAVWWRRVTPFSVDTAITSSQHAAFAQSETAQAVNGMLDSLTCPWMNPREADATAHYKPYQWTVAQQIGLQLPRTLVTTDAVAARDFVESLRQRGTVFKPFLASIQEWRETRLVEQEDLDRLELVRYAPVIFQEYIPGVDLRITIVGERIFAAEIDVRHTSYAVDMRMVVGEGIVRETQLPPELEDKLRELQRRLRLVYGAIDMRRTDSGEYIFFEVNPAGQWLFVEQRTGMNIGQAVADWLAAASDARA